jgi:hypothetical protein
MSIQSNGPRTLVFSLRNIFGRDLFRCPHFEFEDTIRELDGADIIAPHAKPESLRNLLANKIAFHGPMLLKANIEQVPVKRSYDLFFAICGQPIDLLMIDAASKLRDACATKICLIDELWIKQMTPHRYFLEVLKAFDLVVLYYSQSVRALSERLGVRCEFLPPGIDSMLFCPLPNLPRRAVDVYSVGRRSQKTHEALLQMVERQAILYLYDSISGTMAINAKQHRLLFANVAKRSRYFIVNPGLIDRPDRRGNQIEIGNRYFEGAAAGAVMIGERPANEQFERLFDWPDAVMQLSYDSTAIADIINDLDRQADRQETIRRNNIAQAVTHHDWAYRWESILDMVGAEHPTSLGEKKERLHALAEQVAFGSHIDLSVR